MCHILASVLHIISEIFQCPQEKIEFINAEWMDMLTHFFRRQQTGKVESASHLFRQFQ